MTFERGGWAWRSKSQSIGRHDCQVHSVASHSSLFCLSVKGTSFLSVHTVCPSHHHSPHPPRAISSRITNATRQQRRDNKTLKWWFVSHGGGPWLEKKVVVNIRILHTTRMHTSSAGLTCVCSEPRCRLSLLFLSFTTASCPVLFAIGSILLCLLVPLILSVVSGGKEGALRPAT